MDKRQQPKEREPFVIKPSRDHQSWTVLYVANGGRSKPTFEFASERAAQSWIAHQSKSWARAFESGRR